MQALFNSFTSAAFIEIVTASSKCRNSLSNKLRGSVWYHSVFTRLLQRNFDRIDVLNQSCADGNEEMHSANQNDSNITTLEIASAALSIWSREEVSYLSLFRRSFNTEELTTLHGYDAPTSCGIRLETQMKLLDEKLDTISSHMATSEDLRSLQAKYREEFAHIRSQIRELARSTDMDDLETALGQQGLKILGMQYQINDIVEEIKFIDESVVTNTMYDHLWKQLSDIKETLAVQETYLESQEQSIAALLPLLEQVNTLVALGNERSKSNSANDALHLLCQDPYKRAFYDCVTATFSSLYLAASVIRSNKVALSQGNSFIGCVGTVMSTAGSHIPMVGLAVTALGQVLSGIDASLQTQALNKIFSLVRNISEMDFFANYIAVGLITEPQHSLLNKSKLQHGSVFGAVSDLFCVALTSVLNQTIIQDATTKVLDVGEELWSDSASSKSDEKQESDLGKRAATIICSWAIEQIVSSHVDGLFDNTATVADRAQLVLNSILIKFGDQLILSPIDLADVSNSVSRDIVMKSHCTVKQAMASKHPQREIRFIDELAIILLSQHRELVERAIGDENVKSTIVHAVTQFLKSNNIYKTSPISSRSKLFSAFSRPAKLHSSHDKIQLSIDQTHLFGVNRDFVDKHDSFMNNVVLGLQSSLKDLRLSIS